MTIYSRTSITWLKSVCGGVSLRKGRIQVTYISNLVPYEDLHKLTTVQTSAYINNFIGCSYFWIAFLFFFKKVNFFLNILLLVNVALVLDIIFLAIQIIKLIFRFYLIYYDVKYVGFFCGISYLCASQIPNRIFHNFRVSSVFKIRFFSI